MRLQANGHQSATKRSSIEEQRTVGDPAVKPRLASRDRSKGSYGEEKWLEKRIDKDSGQPQASRRSDEPKYQKEKDEEQRRRSKRVICMAHGVGLLAFTAWHQGDRPSTTWTAARRLYRTIRQDEARDSFSRTRQVCTFRKFGLQRSA